MGSGSVGLRGDAAGGVGSRPDNCVPGLWGTDSGDTGGRGIDCTGSCVVDASSGSPFRTLVRGRTTTLVVASAARSCGAVGSDRWTVGGDSVAGGVLGAASGVEGVAPGAADVAEVARGAAKGASGVATGATGVDRDAAGMAGSSSSAPGGPISASPAGGGSHGVSGEGAAGPAVGRDECGSGCAVGKGNDDDGAEAPGSAIDRCTGGFTSGWEVTSGWLVTGPGRTGGADIDESAGEGVDGRAGNGEDANGKDGEAEAIGPTVDRCTGDVTTSSSGPLAGAVVTAGSEVMAGVAIAGSAATTGSTGTTGSAVTASGRSTAPPAPSVSLTSRWIATGAGRTSGGGLTDPSEEKVEGCEDGEGSDGGREACSAVDRGAGDVTAR